MSWRAIARKTPFATALSIGLLGLLASACEPCSGVGACGDPRLRYEGLVLKTFPEAPAGDVSVQFVRTGGARLDSDTLSVRTDSQGRFRLEAPVSADEAVVGDLIIHAPAPTPPTRVTGMRLVPTRARGDRRNLGEWSILYPYFGVQGRLFYRTDGRPARGIAIEFRRTGGIPIEPEVVEDTTDAEGRFNIRPRTEVTGELVGDLVVHPLPPYRTYTVPGIRLNTYLQQRTDTIFRVGVGPHLPYSIVVVWDDTGEAIDNARVEFRPKSGIPIFPTPFVSTSDRFGTAYINPAPLGEGAVVGDVIVRPPAPARPHTFADVRLETVTDDRAVMLLGFFQVPRS